MTDERKRFTNTECSTRVVKDEVNVGPSAESKRQRQEPDATSNNEVGKADPNKNVGRADR